MMRMERRQLLFGSALLAGAALTRAFHPRSKAIAQPQRLLDAALPARIGKWLQVDLPDFVLPPRDALAKSVYDAQLFRGYTDPATGPIYCVLAYGGVQDYALQLHRPEVCYPASGFSVQSLVPVSLQLHGRDMGASVMVAERGGRTETVLFWTRVGSSFPRSQWQVRREIVESVLAGELADGALVRLSTTLIDGATPLLLDFARAMHDAVTPHAQPMLFGRDA